MLNPIAPYVVIRPVTPQPAPAAVTDGIELSAKAIKLYSVIASEDAYAIEYIWRRMDSFRRARLKRFLAELSQPQSDLKGAFQELIDLHTQYSQLSHKKV